MTNIYQNARRFTRGHARNVTRLQNRAREQTSHARERLLISRLKCTIARE